MKPKVSSGGYRRLFNIPELGALISRVHSTVISAGKELEKMIEERVMLIDNLDTFLSNEIMPDGVFLALKKEIKRCQALDFQGSEPDFMIFKRRQGQQHCHIVELKDGHVFDTKKAQAEQRSLHEFVEQNGSKLPYRISTHFCAFNKDDHQAIWDGFKRKIKLEETMTGREFCELLEIDYDEIVETRLQDGPENTKFFILELLKIPKIRNMIEQHLSETK